MLSSIGNQFRSVNKESTWLNKSPYKSNHFSISRIKNTTFGDEDKLKVKRKKMATFGKISEYDAENEAWTQYIERLTHYFTANDIKDAGKQKAILLTVCGCKTYKLMSDLLAPTKPIEKTFAELTKLVENHVHPKPSEIVQRFKFHSRFRKSDESISTFVAQLRFLSQDCNFGETLEVVLRDRLVCGINDDRIQRRLLAERELTFQRALEMSTAMELASKSAADLQRKTAEEREGWKERPKLNYIGKSKPSKPAQNTEHGRSAKHAACYRCGGHHPADVCYYKDTECNYCKKKGHLERSCKIKLAHESKPQSPAGNHKPSKGRYKGKQKPRHGSAKYVEGEESPEDVYSMFKMKENAKEKPIKVQLNISGTKTEMEVDTGASSTVVSERTLQSISKACYPLQSTNMKLRTYTGEEIAVAGTCTVPVSYQGGETKQLRLVVVKDEGPSLLGRDWLKEIKLDWANILHVRTNTESSMEELLTEYAEVFEEKLGTVKDFKAKIHVKETAQPKYFKARPVPYALKEKISMELDRLEAEGTIERVQISEWAAPIVPVVKQDKSIRICGDYKVTVNEVSSLDNYPIPKTDDLLTELGGGEYFTKLDLSQAYQQLELEEDSKKYTTINTHKGLYRYNRLPYGISSAPGIFQRTMDNILQGLEQVRVRVDDILVTGRTTTEHLKNLREVLRRLQEAGIKLKRKKCMFMASEVVYLGHTINKEGIYPVAEKVKAIEQMPKPENVKELQAYLGMVNYYARFLPNLSTVLAPLYSLLKKETQWQWKEGQDSAFKRCQEMLKSSKVLVHFDSEKDIVLACDASAYGLGSVISHRMEDGTERPIAFASRTLTKAEKGYSQLEKEGLAIIFGVKKFHQYLYGHRFEINTDHKPLLGLFKEDKQIPVLAAARIQRWALTLAAYEYVLVYKEGKRIGNADGLSRLPMETKEIEPPVPGEIILLMEQIEVMPVTASQIKSWTGKDPLLATVRDYVQHGWPEETDEKLKAYSTRKSELSVLDGCILWGSRVIVPPQGQDRLLEDLHDSHPGISRMKSLARSYIWWPNMDSDIEGKVKCCEICQVHRKMPGSAPLHPWEWPERPWSRLHVDYAGPFMGHMFFILVDAHSKWIEAYPMNTSTSRATIEKLRQTFAIHGLPEILVSDNGTCFTSEEFEDFLKQNGVKHITSAPYHPSTNGLAERAVQTFKEGMKKQSAGAVETKVSRFLLSYRTTPQSTTGLSPSEMLFNRKVRTRFDLVKPSIGKRVNAKQFMQKTEHDNRHSKLRSFEVGDPVHIKNFGTGSKWLPAVITEVTGPLSYTAKLPDGRVQRRHVDHVLSRSGASELPETEQAMINPEEILLPAPATSNDPVETVSDPLPTQPNEAAVKEPAIVDRPTRTRSTPVKFKDYIRY